MKNLFLPFFTLFIAMNTYATTWYVNINASGTNNGTSWNDAFIDLQDAIAASSYGDEIWVASGIYKPTLGTTKTISFTVKNGTKIYGGFIGTETLLTQKDYQLNVTTLSGEIGTGASNDNSYTVVYFNNVNDQTMIDGFVITGGNNGGTGAGISSKNSSATIKNCKIQGNKADVGAGINHDGTGYIKVENCEFSGNVSTTQGGAINI